MGTQILSTGVLGPLPPNTFDLLLGCASLMLKGLNIFPGVIDNDYRGEIMILASSTSVLLTMRRIAQLLLIPLNVPIKSSSRSLGNLVTWLI